MITLAKVKKSKVRLMEAGVVAVLYKLEQTESGYWMQVVKKAYNSLSEAMMATDYDAEARIYFLTEANV